MAQLKLLVPPADTAQLYERWYEFAVYLSHATGDTFAVHIADSMADFHKRMYVSDMVFCPAQEASRLGQIAHFEPLGRPSGQTQEVAYVVTEASGINNLQALENRPMLSASCQAVTRLGQTLLHLKGLSPSELKLQDHWMQVIRRLHQGECDAAIVSRCFFESLKPISKMGLKAIAYSQLGRLHNQLMLSPAWHHRLESFCELVQTMHRDEKGREVLEHLGIKQWHDMPPNEAQTQVKILQLSRDASLDAPPALGTSSVEDTGQSHSQTTPATVGSQANLAPAFA
ncbi:MAG: PhnD/SsuA/transferrin family substrate-binding protein [Pontibacterium sp.]